MTITTTPNQLSLFARVLLALSAGASVIVALNLDNPESHLWLDNGQPYGFAAAAVLSVLVALRPWHRRVALAAGTSTCGAAAWRLTTAVIESFRHNGPGDWLRVGTWAYGLTGWSMSWVFIWYVIGLTVKVRALDAY